jgi:hypothetical protein
MSEDYERRIRNLEVTVMALGVLISDTLPANSEVATKEILENFFYSVDAKGMDGPELEPPPIKSP